MTKEPLANREARPKEVDDSRRAFLRSAVVVGVAAAAGEIWRARRVEGLHAVEPIAVPAARGLQVGEAVEFEAPSHGLKGLVVRTADGLLAVDRRCPHLGCPVMWSQENARFDCPCHRAAFDGRTGAVLHGPPREGLRRLTVEERGTEVWLRA